MAESGKNKRRPRRLGEYELIDEIGRGGMGVVYKARQASMGRLVALKVLPSFAGMDPGAVARFRREAEAAGRLAHPGIVPIYGVGEAEGIHFFAMELVEGPSLASVTERLIGRLPERLLGSLIEEADLVAQFPQLREPPGAGSVGTRYSRSCAALIADVANALSSAHAQKIVHRDLKPSNVLIHPSGRAVLVDFGLARDELATGLTRTGDAVGTPSYMAPEQASGSKEVDGRVDVYGLGATLYQLLTLRPPFDGAHAGEIMRQILTEDPVPVRKHNCRVPVDLETIVHKCLAKDPDERYPCIEALEMDLRAFLAGKGITARPPSGRQRMLRAWQRHRKAMLAAAGSLLVAAVAGVLMGVVSLHRAETGALAQLDQARDALLAGNLDAARSAYSEAMVLSDDSEMISDHRCRHVAAMFDAMYRDPARRAVLARWCESLSQVERERLAPYLARLAGQGRVVLAGLRRSDRDAAAVELRAFRDGELGPPQPLPEDGILPIGDYLARIEIPGRATAVQSVAVERDGEIAVRLRSRWSKELPSNSAQVLGTEVADDLAVSTQELSLAEYREFLRDVSDPVLRAELTPAGWDEQSRLPGTLPVRGLSFRQARAAAASLGAHLPSRRDYLRIGNAGLQDLPFPWGTEADPGRIAADPDRFDAPKRVDTYREGATSHGIVHVLGNVAEILGAEHDGALLLAGGHFQSDPAKLRLTQPDTLFESLSGADDVRVYAGMRLARFLPQPDAPQVESAMLERRSVFLESGVGRVHDWILDGRGSITYGISVTGIHSRVEHNKSVAVDTEGFRQTRGVQVVDGHGRALQLQPRYVLESGEVSAWDVQLASPGQKGSVFRLEIKTWLEPSLGLRGDKDAYLLQVPLTVAGVLPVLHRVSLPAGCRVESVRPEPTTQYFMNDAPNLVWEFPKDGSSRRTIPAIIRFRRDGRMSSLEPTHAEVQAQVEEFLDALRTSDRALLEERLHPAFLQLPAHAGRKAVLDGQAENGWRHRYESPRIVDVTAVGATVTVELTADWIVDAPSGAQQRLEDWPLRLQMRREGDAWRIVRFLPAVRADAGTIHDSIYVNELLNATLKPPVGVPLTRTQDELAEMQVSGTPPRTHGGKKDEGEVGFVVLGRRAAPGESDELAQVYLSSGTILLGYGIEIGNGQATLGTAENPVEGRAQDWVFPGAGADRGWARERWIFVRRGLRCFLVREIARGADRRQAEERFARSREWFAEMARSLRFD